MARSKRATVTLENAFNDGETDLKVGFRAIYPEGSDPNDPEEADFEIRFLWVEEGDAEEDEFVDVSLEWQDSDDLPELEEMVREVYLEQIREKYVDRLYR